MKKYIKPVAKTVNVTTAIMAGSFGDVKGEYNGTLPLKSKEYDFDDEEDEF